MNNLIDSTSIIKIITKLDEYVRKEKFVGYDPYDTLNSKIPFRIFGKYFMFVLIQIQKRNPINIRAVLGIKKEIIPKAYALFLSAYSILYQTTKNEEYLKQATIFVDWFAKNNLAEYKGLCWTKNFALVHPDYNRPKTDPSSVLACFVGEALFDYYEATHNEKAKEMIKDILIFIKNHVPVYDTNDECCFSYTTRKQDFVHNANMHVAEIFAKAFYLTSDDEYKNISIKATEYSVKRQNANGAWEYSSSSKGKNKQIDFHQGFIINSLYNVIKFTGAEKFKTALEKGLKFYYENQFDKNGASLYRFPHKYPLDVHNQAQGIISFGLLSNLDNSYNGFADKILSYTLKYLYNKKKGFFYFRKNRLYTNKIPYIRWNQAWMLLALAHYLKSKGIKNEQ